MLVDKQSTERVPGYCALCISRCGSVAVVEDGHFIALEPNPAHPTGKALCVSVTLVDGLVYSRTALNHSVNYRSAVCFGLGRVVEDREEQLLASYALIERYFPGRTEGVDYEPIPEAHLKGTAYVAIDVTDASAKVRRGGPKGPRDDNPTAPGTAGVVEFSPAR